MRLTCSRTTAKLLGGLQGTLHPCSVLVLLLWVLHGAHREVPSPGKCAGSQLGSKQGRVVSRPQGLLQQVPWMGVERGPIFFSLKAKCNLNIGSCSLRKRRVGFLVFRPRKDEMDCQSRCHPLCLGRGQRGTS